MGKNVTPEQVRKEIAAALKVHDARHAEKYEAQQELIREQASQIEALGTADQRAKYDNASGEEMSYIRGDTIAETLENLGRSTGVRMFGDGPGRAPVAVGQTGGLPAVRMMRAMAAAHVNGGSPLDVAHLWDDKTLITNLERSQELHDKARGTDEAEKKRALRALGTETLGSGASFIETALASEWIPLLQPKTVIRRAGVTTLPMPTGKMRMPFVEDAAEAEYEKECSGPNADKITDGELLAERKILTMVVCMCNEWLDESSYAVDVLLRDLILQQMARKEDIAFLRGDGLQNSPFGLSYYADLAGNVEIMPDVSALTGAAKLQALMDGLTAMMSCVDCGDVPMEKAFWALSCRDKYGLTRCLDGNGNRVFFDEMRNGTLLGHPFYDTTQLPTTLDTSGSGDNDESEIYFADASSLRIFETGSIETDVFRDATYRDSKGQTRHGINDRHTVIRSVARHDFVASQRGKEVCKGTQVTWGA